MTRKWTVLLTILVSSLDALIHGCSREPIMVSGSNIEICHNKGMIKNKYTVMSCNLVDHIGTDLMSCNLVDHIGTDLIVCECCKRQLSLYRKGATSGSLPLFYRHLECLQPSFICELINMLHKDLSTSSIQLDIHDISSTNFMKNFIF